MKKGDIILTPFPFTDLSGSKLRPALVLHVSELDVTVNFISTQLAWQQPLDIILKPTSINGLKKTSLIRIGKITCLDRSLVIGKIGALEINEIKLINKNLIELFELNEFK